jgi:catechol 2,3-dioxygenase-like lactoylglutathione lyase family enzyme
MTTSIMAQTKREGVLAVHSLDEHVFSVPNLEDARSFYTAFGLEVRDHGDGLALFAHNNPQRYARLIKGEKKRLLWLSFGVYEEDFERFVQFINERGIERIASPDTESPGGLWIRSNDGFPVQIKVAPKSSPSSPSPRVFEPECNGRGRAPASTRAPKVHPLYLSHTLIFTKSVSESLKFYSGVLGLQLSDSSGEDPMAIAFMHSPHGSDHHLLAFLISDDYGFHHSSWAVNSIDQVGLGMKQMNEAGHTYGWGVGRHVLGSNYFRYTRDPWGSYVEYSYDIDFVPHDLQWPAKNHPPPDSFYLWGPDVPEGFGTNFEAQH